MKDKKTPVATKRTKIVRFTLKYEDNMCPIIVDVYDDGFVRTASGPLPAEMLSPVSQMAELILNQVSVASAVVQVSEKPKVVEEDVVRLLIPYLRVLLNKVAESASLTVVELFSEGV